MRQIIAYVRTHRLPAVALALQNVEGLTGMSFSTVHGFGRDRAGNAEQEVVRELVDFVPMDRVEVFCSDEIADSVIETIVNSAHEGLRGDSRIYVCDVVDAIRIGTRERGASAV